MSIVAYVCNVLIVEYDEYRRDDMFILDSKIFSFLIAIIDAIVSRNLCDFFIVHSTY